MFIEVTTRNVHHDKIKTAVMVSHIRSIRPAPPSEYSDDYRSSIEFNGQKNILWIYEDYETVKQLLITSRV
jgi:hypothetical protein